MLAYLFKNFKENKIIKLLDKFFSSGLWIIVVGILTTISELFGKEIFVYWLFVILGVIIPSLFLSDMRGMIAPFVFGYITFSRKNNNLNEGLSLTSSTSFKTTIIILVSLILLFSLLRLVFDLIYNKEKRKIKPKFFLGFVLLGVCYMLGGLLTPYYSFQTFRFGLVEILSLSIGYFYFLYTIDFKSLKKEYFAVIFTVLGLSLSAQVLDIYLDVGINRFLSDSSDIRSEIFTGWGCCNNIGGELAFCVAAPAYLAIKKKPGFLYVILGWIIYSALLFAQSRGGMLFGTICYAISIILMIIYSSSKNKIACSTVFLLLFVSSSLSIIVFWKNYYYIFKSVIDSFSAKDLNQFSSNRIEIYIYGLNQFKEFPLFGVGFYNSSDIYRFWNVPGNFIPPRYHNTFVQLLASTGVFGLLAYLFHRFQTFKFIFKKINLEKAFILLIMLGLLLTSLVDCHFFNLGPGLGYSVLLALLEGKHNIKKTIS